MTDRDDHGVSEFLIHPTTYVYRKNAVGIPTTPTTFGTIVGEGREGGWGNCGENIDNIHTMG